MKNIKYFEGYDEKNCKADLKILHWKKFGQSGRQEYRLLIKLTSLSGTEFNPDGTTISEDIAKKLINEFGAKVEER